MLTWYYSGAISQPFACQAERSVGGPAAQSLQGEMPLRRLTDSLVKTSTQRPSRLPPDTVRNPHRKRLYHSRRARLILMQHPIGIDGIHSPRAVQANRNRRASRAGAIVVWRRGSGSRAVGGSCCSVFQPRPLPPRGPRKLPRCPLCSNGRTRAGQGRRATGRVGSRRAGDVGGTGTDARGTSPLLRRLPSGKVLPTQRLLAKGAFDRREPVLNRYSCCQVMTTLYQRRTHSVQMDRCTTRTGFQTDWRDPGAGCSKGRGVFVLWNEARTRPHRCGHSTRLAPTNWGGPGLPVSESTLLGIDSAGHSHFNPGWRCPERCGVSGSWGGAVIYNPSTSKRW